MSSTTTTPKVSIIIPSWTGEVSRPMRSIEQQTFCDYEVEVVQRASPVGRARNLGAQRTKADILLFVDDDITLGHEHVLQQMVDLLESDAQIAIVGVPVQVPGEASRFQHAVARQVPRFVDPVVSDNLVSNPPLDRYGFTTITGGCCAIRRSVFEEVGGFDEELLNADDTDFFYRVRRRGYNLVLAANCWVYHEPPASMKVLLRKSFWYGMGHVLETRKSPERGMAVLPLNRWYGPLGLIAFVMGFPFAFFVHYYFDPVRRLVLGFRPLKTLSTYATLCGYVYGWYHGKPRKAVALLWSGGIESTHARRLSDLDVAELLERDVVPLEASEAHVVLKGQIVLVTGAAGSIGSELCRQLLNYEPARVIALDNNETGLFDLVESLRLHEHSAYLCPYIGDIRDIQGMERLFANEQPQIVFHAAAYKHVPLLERHPEQALRNNTLATFHLCRLAQIYEVDRFVFVSTDKAANPTSILGATKRLGEIVVQSMAKSANCTTRFCAVRFGNVIGSRGSVVPVFARQIEQGGPVTVTDPAAMRYFMTIPEACGLVILTAVLADQGGLYLLDMGEPVRILDLAIKMIRLFGLREGRDVPIVYTGLRPGERLHETLVAVGEELVPTMNGKIFSVKHGYGVPMLPQVTQWMLSLDEDLQSENSEGLRERLFELVQVHELITTSNRVRQEGDITT